MAERCEKHKRVDVGTNKLERHHWRMGLAACRKVSSSAFRLAVVIEDHMNERSGEAWPDQETLSRRAAMSARQVREHLTALVGAGWLNVLSGKDRTRPKTRRGLHYRPTWPDQATKDRCLIREYATTMEPINTGGNPPVLNQNETGNLASQKRKSGASIPAEKRRNTGENPPLSYEATYEVTYTGRGSSRVPEVLDNSSISGGAAFADASGSLTGGEMDHSLGDVGEPPAWIKEIPPAASPDDYLAGAEAFEALCASGDDPSFASPDKTSDTDEHQSFADEDDEFADDDDCEGRIPYDDPSSDEGGTDLGDASSDSRRSTSASLSTRLCEHSTRSPEPAAGDPRTEHLSRAAYAAGANSEGELT